MQKLIHMAPRTYKFHIFVINERNFQTNGMSVYLAGAHA